MDERRYKDVTIALIIPELAVRSSLRNILHNNGFREIRLGQHSWEVIQFMEDKLKVPDLIICGGHFEDGNIASIIKDVRSGKAGTNPLVPIITIAQTGDPHLIHMLMEVGVDDLLIQPVSTKAVLDRIKSLVNNRKRFVVSEKYIGPDRRTDGRPSHVPTIEAPSTLSAKIKGEDPATVTNKISDLISDMNVFKYRYLSLDIAEIVSEIKIRLHQIDDVKKQLEIIRSKAKEAGQRTQIGRFQHVKELSSILVKIIDDTLENGFMPKKRQMILVPLSQALVASFTDDPKAIQMVEAIKSMID